MPLLNEIAYSGFQGMAPTPVEKYAISKYLVQHDLFNLLPFRDIGMGTGIGNIAVTVLTYSEPASAKFRRIGNEYDIENSVPVPVTITLKMLGGSFQTDRVLERAFSQNPRAVDNWTESQIAQKINSIINGFAKFFIGGDSSTDPLQFDGVMKFLSNNPGQYNDTALDISGGLSFENAITVEEFLNQSVAKLSEAPTCVITTRLRGKPFLQTLEQYRNRGIQAIKVNDRDYYMFMGMPIVGLEDDAFPAEVLEKGIPFIFAKFDEERGIHVAVPQNPGMGNQYAVLDIVKPDLQRESGNNAVFVKNGGVELCCAPVIVDPYCVSMCYINNGGGGNGRGIDTVTVTGADTLGAEGSVYEVSFDPADASYQSVDYSLTTTGGDAAIVTTSGKSVTLKGVSNGAVKLTATVKDATGKSITGEKDITVQGL